MPESAEVRLIVDQLAKFAIGKKLTGTAILGCRYKDIDPDGFWENRKVLPIGIEAVSCKGKFIYWTLEKENYIWNTLGMTGGWSRAQSKHCALQFDIDGEPIYFNDPRHFGTIKFVHGKNLLESKLNSIGPDMLAAPPIRNTFHQIIMSGGSKTIVELIMNQAKISGVGNYIKSESLYRAKISPWRECKTLNVEEMNQLYDGIISVIKESYEMGGATLATYKNFEGNAGNFTKKLAVYKKLVDSFGNKVIKSNTPDKRTSWFVPEIQK